MKRTVVALFRKYDEAEKAVRSLLDQGVERNDLSIMAADPKGAAREPDKHKAHPGSGAVVGGLAGALLGLTAMAVPGIGPVVAAGPIAGLLAGGLAGALTGLGLEHDSAEYYARGVQEGGAVVAIRAPETDVDQIEAKLKDLRAQEVDPGTSAGAEPRVTLPMYRAESITPGRGDHQSATGDATEPEDADDTRVKNDAGPEHWAPHNTKYSSSFDEFAGEMARTDTYILAGRADEYEGYKDAFDFGHRMAYEKRFANRDWANCADDLRGEWDRGGALPWDRVRTYVQHGWEAARGMG